MNQRRIRVNVKDSLENTFLAVGHPYRAKRNGEIVLMQNNTFAILLAVTKSGANPSWWLYCFRFGVCCAGRFDGFFELGLKTVGYCRG